MTDWTPESRPIPPELTPQYPHAIYTPTVFPPFTQRWAEATPDMLLQMAKETR